MRPFAAFFTSSSAFLLPGMPICPRIHRTVIWSVLLRSVCILTNVAIKLSNLVAKYLFAIGSEFAPGIMIDLLSVRIDIEEVRSSSDRRSVV